MGAMIDKLLETLRAWYSTERGRLYSMDLTASGGGYYGRVVLHRSKQTALSIPLVAGSGEDWPEEGRERILRLIVELQQEMEA
jgi:hypothetical protein